MTTRDYSPPSQPYDLHPLQRLHIAVFGLQGDNGLNSDVKTLRDDLQALRDDLAELQATLRTIWLAGKLIRWFVLGLITLAVLIAPDDLADAIVRALGAAKTLGGLL